MDLFGQLLAAANQRQQGEQTANGLHQQLALALGRAQQDARKLSLAEQLQRAQLGNIQSETDARRFAMEHPKPQAPVFASPEWEEAYTRQKQIDSRYRPAPTSQLPSQAERTAGGLYNTAEAVADTLDKMENTVAGKAAGMIPTLGNVVLGETDPDLQRMNQAADQFITSYVYAVSGKQVNENEFKRLTNAMIPQPGDAPQTLAAKREARRVALASMRMSAGRATTPLAPQVHDSAQVAPAPRPASHVSIWDFDQ